MRPKTKTTQLFIYIGIFSCTFGIAKFNTNDISYQENQRAYWMILVGAISIFYAYYRNSKEKDSDKNENDKLE